MADTLMERLAGLWKTASQKEPLPTIAWSWALTPPFPTDWPPRTGTSLVCYAYSQGEDMTGSLADGVHVGRPWARAWRGEAGWDDAHVELLPQSPTPAGIQGVTPVSPERLTQADDVPIGALLENLLGRIAAPEPGTLVALRAGYRAWIRENSVIAALLRPLHAPLFEWLDEATASVIVCDLFHAYDPDHEHVVHGFRTFGAAAEYARRRVRDSLEEMRRPGLSDGELRDLWHSFGEDARAVDADGERTYTASAELDRFIAEPASVEERDWLSLQPISPEPGPAMA
jgi:hypothetical protein